MNIYERTYTVYSEHDDITFIMRDTMNDDGLVSVEVTGFYYGTPNIQATVKFKNKLKATF